jgi:putative transcriptional regulator
MGPTIKTRLRVLRAEQEWSQANLAAQVGVSRQTINSIENGRYHPNLRLAFKIARAFGKRVEEVFVYSEAERRDESARPQIFAADHRLAVKQATSKT